MSSIKNSDYEYDSHDGGKEIKKKGTNKNISELLFTPKAKLMELVINKYRE